MAENTGRSLSNTEKKKFDFTSWIILYLNVALFLFLWLTRGSFLTFNNIHSILYEVSFSFFAAIGFTLLIIMGELDLSVGSLFGFGGAMMGLFVFSYKMPLWGAIPLAVLVSACIGLAAGIIITRFKVNSMMITIGVMMAVKGLNWMLVNKFSGRQLPATAKRFASKTVYGVYWTIIVMVIVALILEILLVKSRHLKQLYYMGQNVSTTILYGLKANTVKCVCFALSAALSALGGAFMTARLAHPNVTIGANLEIEIITAAVIGGASIFGGRGSMVRTMLGLLFVYMLKNGMTSYNINSYIQQIILGSILVIAIYLDVRINTKKS